MPKHAKTKDISSVGASSSKRARNNYTVPFARGFKHRDHNARCLAVGFTKLENIPRPFNPGPELTCDGSIASTSSGCEELFKPIPHPTSPDDWLAMYNEEGQTYAQFLQENPWLSCRKVKYTKQQFHSSGKTLMDKYPDGKICIVQLGKFDNKYIKFADIIEYSSKYLCLPVEELPPLDLEVQEGKVVVIDDPASRGSGGRSMRVKRTELATRYDRKTGNVQLRIDSVLSKLRIHIPSYALCLVALTTMDLYGEDTDLFVAGMAAGNQRVAVFSLLRYDPNITFSKEEWYDQISVPRPIHDYETGRCLMIHRSCKLVVHEILHLLGVDHCIFFECCMNGSGHLKEDFSQPMHLCPVDLRKLHTLVGFDVQKRYKELWRFYTRHGLSEEAKWIQKRLHFLDQK